MRAFSIRWSEHAGWSEPLATRADRDLPLVLAFGPVKAPAPAWFAEVAAAWPHARVVYCTGGGQIDGTDVRDDDVVLTGMHFDRAKTRVVSRNGAGAVPCDQLGATIGREFAIDHGLRHLLVFLDGLHVNGAAFTRGLSEVLPHSVTVSGGLASDGTVFAHTGVGLDGPPEEGRVIAIGFYGESLAIGTGSAGGWDSFGPERIVTRAEGPTVYEFDGERALDVYRRFLGDLVAELPGSALLFPLALTEPGGGTEIVRTILGIDEAAGSLRFAGDVPQGHRVRLMRATNDRLLDGAAHAARQARTALGTVEPAVMLCISCIGRRAVLRSRVAEEVDEVVHHAPGAVVSGYYSNGEIAPPAGPTRRAALLHNQTMTITAIGER